MTSDMYQNQALYESKARENTRLHAAKTMEQWLSESGVSEIVTTHPAQFVDPISNDLFEDPVISAVSG